MSTGAKPAGTGEAFGLGLLAGALTMLRLELIWLPWFWLWRIRRCLDRRAVVAAVAACLLLISPWLVRNQRVCGQPLFTLQAHAEHLKQTGDWPDYTIYRSLSPEPFAETLSQRPSLMLQKGRAGLKFFVPAGGRFFPWPLWLAGGLLLIRRRAYRSTDGGGSPLAVSWATVVLLAIQYALFSHALRHLLVVMPVVGLEILLAGGRWLAGARPRWRASVRAVVLTGAVGAMLLVLPPRTPGLERALGEARAIEPRLAPAVAEVNAGPPGPIFCDNGAVPWLAGRAAVWVPADPEVTEQLRRQVPALANAPVYRLFPAEG
jgi:hypothetical protein